MEFPEEILNYQILISKHFNSRKEVLPVFSNEDLGKIVCKTNIYVGKKDIILKADETIKRSSLIKNVNTSVFEDLGHSLVDMTSKIIIDLEK